MNRGAKHRLRHWASSPKRRKQFEVWLALSGGLGVSVWRYIIVAYIRSVEFAWNAAPTRVQEGARDMFMRAGKADYCYPRSLANLTRARSSSDELALRSVCPAAINCDRKLSSRIVSLRPGMSQCRNVARVARGGSGARTR